MRSTERYVSYYDLVVKNRAKHAPIPPIGRIVELWQKYGKDGALVHERDKGTLRYRIGDMNLNATKGLVVLLVRRADKNAPNATFSDLETGVLRVARKEEYEGGDSAAHVVLALGPHEPNTYLCLIESVSGLSHRIVQGLLNDLVRQACKGQGTLEDGVRKPAIFAYKHASGGDRESTYQPHIELEGYLADDLARDLDEGTLRHVELVKSATHEPLGGDPYLVEDEYRLRIRTDKKLPPNNRLGRLTEAWRSKKTHFDKARIAFKDRDDRFHQVEVSLDRGTAEQPLYVRSAHLANINPPLDQSCEAIQPQLSDRMVRLLMAERSGG